MQIYTADGKLIGEVGEQRRIPVKLENVPQRLQDAFLATEDSRFYDHHGLDPVGIARAILLRSTMVVHLKGQVPLHNSLHVTSS